MKLRIGQLDGSAGLDVAAIGWGTGTVSVFANDGQGQLGAPVVYAAQHGGYDDLEVGDVSGDGRDDLVVMSGQTYAIPNISVLAQLPGGGFATPATYRVGGQVNTNGSASATSPAMAGPMSSRRMAATSPRRRSPSSARRPTGCSTRP